MEKVYKWLSKHFEYDKPFEEVLKEERATSFLLIWPIFEQKLFNGYLRINEIPSFSEKWEAYYSDIDVEEITKYFYERYQDNDNKRRLMHDSKVKSFNIILEKAYDSLSYKEKMELILVVVFRYRNNIFHGNKGIKSWSKYSKEIDYCITVMMNMIDRIAK